VVALLCFVHRGFAGAQQIFRRRAVLLRVKRFALPMNDIPMFARRFFHQPLKLLTPAAAPNLVAILPLCRFAFGSDKSEGIAHAEERRELLKDSAGGCRPQKEKLSLSCLLHQAILMMQAAKHRRLHNTVTGGQLVSVVAGRNTALVGFRNSRT